jgi:hypothetical protein
MKPGRSRPRLPSAQGLFHERQNVQGRLDRAQVQGAFVGHALVAVFELAEIVGIDPGFFCQPVQGAGPMLLHVGGDILGGCVACHE